MPKRRDLIRKIEKQARSQGVAFGELREGSKHTIYTLDGVRLVIPRHRDINEITAESIYSDAEVKLGKGWWR